MRQARHPIAALACLSFGAMIGAWSCTVRAADETTANTAPSTPAIEQPVAAEQAPASAGPSTAAEQLVPAPDSAPPKTAGAEVSPPAAPAKPQTPQPSPGLLPPAPPASLQTLVDQRRDRVRQQREAMLDAYGWRDDALAPGWAAYRDDMERYRDAMRALYRAQRDYSRQHHNEWMDAFCPWSRPQRDWNELRSYQNQMDWLDWQERRNASLYGQPWGYGPGMPW